MKLRYQLGLCLLGACVSQLAWGQKDSTMLNQSVTLEREFTPTVRQYQKIDRQPAAIATPASATNEVPEFATFEPDVVTSNEIQVVPAGQVVVEPSAEPMGYVQGILGTYWNADLEAGVHGKEFAVDALGFFFRNTFENVEDLPGGLTPGWSEWKSRYINGQIVGSYSTTLANDGQLTAHLGAYGHSYKPMMQRSKVSHFGKASADVQYEDDDLLVRLGYSYMGSTLLDGSTTLYYNSLTNKDTTRTSHSSHHVVDALVRYGLYDYDPLWQAWVDVDMRQTFAEDNYFAIKPSLHGRWMPFDDAWRSVYGSVGIGTTRADLYSTLVALPLVAGSVNYDKSFDVLDVTLGYEDNENGQLRWGGEVQLKSTTDALCAYAILTKNSSNELMGTFLTLGNEDNVSFAARAHADYELNQLFKAKALFAFTGYSEDDAACGRPRVELGLHLASDPGKFHFELNMDGALARKMKAVITDGVDTNTTFETVDMDALWNLSLRAEYQFLPELKFMLQGDNLLNQSQQLWPSVPADGIDFVIGARYEF